MLVCTLDCLLYENRWNTASPQLDIYNLHNIPHICNSNLLYVVSLLYTEVAVKFVTFSLEPIDELMSTT